MNEVKSNEDKKFPISEIFVSPQGEGVYTGATMCFVRLAGCTVGRPYPASMYEQREIVTPQIVNAGEAIKTRPLFPRYIERCTLYDGREFPCDTDYRVKERLTAKEIAAQVPVGVRRVCITGGEPCMHELSTLLSKLYEAGKQIHLETSGTILFDNVPVWVTVSPKKNYLHQMIERADELKLLVDKNFVPDQWLGIAELKPTYLHPVNFEHTINSENLLLCMKWQKLFPCFRVGVQLHKAISMLTKEHVR